MQRILEYQFATVVPHLLTPAITVRRRQDAVDGRTTGWPLVTTVGVPDLSLVVTAGGSWPCVFATQGSHEVLQCSPSELERRSLFELVHEGDAHRLRVVLACPAQAPASSVLFLRVARADGTYPWFEVRVQRPVRGETSVVVLAFHKATAWELPAAPVAAAAPRWTSPDPARTFGSPAAAGHVVRQVLANGCLHLEYRPVVRLLDEVARGAEAMVRIRDAAGGSFPSQALLDVAVTAEVIADLDAQVLDLVALEQATWRSGSAVPVVSLNLTGQAIEDGRICERLLSAARAGALATAPPLQVELSERALLGSSRRAMDRLHALHDHGVRLGVDNFGADAVSLALLWRFPLDYVKVHPSVTAQLKTVRAAGALLRSIVDMAHSLDLTVVAQGVTTREHRLLAHEAGCDEGQGDLWPSRPTLAALTQLADRPRGLTVVS
jgi:EAL domain-containing protein (putative c-di-GMP-specific phosphodiesterase class I)